MPVYQTIASSNFYLLCDLKNYRKKIKTIEFYLFNFNINRWRIIIFTWGFFICAQYLFILGSIFKQFLKSTFDPTNTIS